MSTLADRTIEANRGTQDRLAAFVAGLGDEELSRPSGCSDWTVAQVLSHLGSGAEIALATLRAAEADRVRADEANTAVWDRWNAMSPREQADGFLRAGEEFTAALDRLDSEQRAQLRVPMGFLPQPADVALFTGLRLNEAALHAWDVEVAFDPSAKLPPETAAVLLEQWRGQLGMLLAFIAKPQELGGRTASVMVRTTSPVASLGLLIGERVALGGAPALPDAELALPAEALLRLVTGRLRTEHTPAAVSCTQAVSIDDLRRVFPGF